MTDTTDTPAGPQEAPGAPVTDVVDESASPSGGDDRSLTQELEAVVARIDEDPDDPAAVLEEGAPVVSEGDDIESAISGAEEKIAAEPAAGVEPAPAPAIVHHPDESVQEPDAASASDDVPWWPFIAYNVLWLIFAGALVWYFEQLPAGTAVFEAELYGITVLVGVVLAALGPALILATWIGAIGRPGASKSALFFSALIRGSVATALGVATWWIALLVLDQLRLGRVL